MSKYVDLNITKALREFGLSDKESAVYVTLLEQGEMSAVKLGQLTSLHRQFVYNALLALKEKDLVLKLGTPTRALWRAQTPRKFIALAEEQELKAAKLSDQLLALAQRKVGQEFEVVEGAKAFRSRSIDNVRQAPADSTVLMVCGQWDQYFELAGERMHAQWEKIRLGKEIHFRVIGPASLRRAMSKEVGERDLTDYRIFPGLEENLVNTIIYPTHVDFDIYGEPHLTFSIKNPDVVASQKRFFEALWQKSEVL